MSDGELESTREAWRRREPRWLDAEQQHAWRAYVLGTQLLFDQLDDDLRRHGLSHVEYEILVRLSEAEGRELRMARLADSLAHSRSRVTHTVKRMEADGLVSRCGSAEDGRGVVCRLTERGDLLLRNLAPIHVAGVRDYLVDVVDPQDFAALGRVMDAVADRLIKDHPERELRDKG